MDLQLKALELQYFRGTYDKGEYQWRENIQKVNGSSVTLSATGGQESLFELAPDTYNHYNDLISFDFNIPADAGLANFAHTNGVPFFREIQYSTTGSSPLVNIVEADRYSNGCFRHNLKREEIITNDKMNEGVRGAISNNTGAIFSGLNPSRFVVARPTDAAPATEGSDTLGEPIYILSGGNTVNNGVNVALTFKVIIPMRYWCDTLFGVNKDTWMGGQNIYIRFVWNAQSRMAYRALSNANPTNGVQEVTGCTITNLAYYSCQETNQAIKESLMKQVREKGLSMYVPYVWHEKKDLNNTSQSVDNTYFPGLGSKLLKIYWTPYTTNAVNNTAYDHNCLGNVKIQRFYTEINNVRTSAFDYVLATKNDWLVKSRKLKGSCIGSSNEYYYNWTWIEDFTSNDSRVDQDSQNELQNYSTGLDLKVPIQWRATATTNNTPLTHYVYGVTLRNLVIKPGLVMFMDTDSNQTQGPLSA